VSDPPLALLYNSSPAPGAQQLEVINAKGVEQWGLTQAQEGQYFGLTAQQYGAASNGPQIGGSNLFFFFQSTPTSAYQVAVVSQSGTLIGRGSAPALNPYADGTGPFQVSPTGTEWAWTTDETPNASGQHHGVVEVGGLGEVNRIVYRWVAPAGFTEQLINWTNTGIIMQRTELGGPFPCGGYDSTDYAWFAINPVSDALTELFAGNDRFQDASSGVTAAIPLNAPHTVIVNGVSYSESQSVAASASISPDGVHVAVFRESFDPCGGGNIPTTSVEIITVANHSHVDLSTLYFDSWCGPSDIFAVRPDGSTWVYTLAGTPVLQISPVGASMQLVAALS
jgi:hypothetical protein